MLAPMESRVDHLSDGAASHLLAELNHRVGNELQVALSALRLAKGKLASGEAACFIEAAMIRLERFGEVHRLLDRQRTQGPLARRLEALCRAVSLSRAAPLEIRLTADDVTADEETAWTICVVAFELMTNAFRHAFPGGLPGVIGVVLRQDGEGLLLTVTDHGVGSFVGSRSAERVWHAPGLGSGIITQLADRLGGFATRVSGPAGTTATLRIPMARSAGA